MKFLKNLILRFFTMFYALISNTKAMASVGLGVVSVIVGIMVSLLIGIVVIMALITSQGTAGKSGWSTTANSTWTSLQTQIWAAFGLLVITPIIIGAGAILYYLRAGMGG